MNTSEIGLIVEFETMLAFIRLGYNVLIPQGNHARYDFAVDIGGRFYKMQAKSSSSTNGGATFRFMTRSTMYDKGKLKHRFYDKGEIDYFVTAFNGKCYMIPAGECTSDKTLRIKPSKNNQGRRVVWAKDYEVEKVVKQLEES